MGDGKRHGIVQAICSTANFEEYLGVPFRDAKGDIAIVLPDPLFLAVGLGDGFEVRIIGSLQMSISGNLCWRGDTDLFLINHFLQLASG